MLWLRGLFFLSPLALILGASLLHRAAGRFEMPPASGAFVTSIQGGIGPLSPFPLPEGPAREIAELVFEPLLARDGKGRLAPNLVVGWEERTFLTVHCASEEDAGEAEALLSARWREAGPLPGTSGSRLLALDRSGAVLGIVLEGFEDGAEEALLSQIDRDQLGGYRLVELRLRHSVRNSLRSFLATSVERGRIAMLDYDGDTRARLFVRGEVAPLLRELELYYEANPSLEAEIQTRGTRSHLASREMVLSLHPEAFWHDGRQVTTEDLLFSYQWLTSEDSPLPLASAFRFAEAVEAIDSRRVRVACRETPATMLESWEQLPLLPAHLLSLSDGGESWHDFLEHPVGSGPYRVATRRRDGGIELAAHPRWHRGKAPQERLVYRRLASLEAKLLALRWGRLDSLVPDRRFAEWARRHPESHFTRRGQARFQHFIAWNLERPPFDQMEVRRALAHAINLAEILVDDAERFRSPIESLFSPGSPYRETLFDSPEHNPPMARALLAAVGLGPAGEEASPWGFRLHFNEAHPEHLRFARALAEQWGRLGIEVELAPLSWTELLEGALEQRDFEAAILSWEIPKGRDRFAAWHSEAIPPQGGNFFGLRDAEVDELLESLRREQDEDALQTAAAGLQERLAALQPCLFLAETGRIWWFRQGGVAVSLPDAESPVPLADDPPLSGHALEASRPWWIRLDASPASPAPMDR